MRKDNIQNSLIIGCKAGKHTNDDFKTKESRVCRPMVPPSLCLSSHFTPENVNRHLLSINPEFGVDFAMY